jgi:hypothetical protein
MSTRSALLLAGSIIAVTLALALAGNAGYLADETDRRTFQIMLGLIVVIFANLSPKTLAPLSETSEPSKAQAQKRFTGWTLVIGGLGYALAWLVLPINSAGIWAMAVLGTSLLLVVARCTWSFNRRSFR